MKFRENGNTCVIIYTATSDPPLISFLESSGKEILSPSSIFSLVFYSHLISSNEKIINQAITIISFKKQTVFFNIPHIRIPYCMLLLFQTLINNNIQLPKNSKNLTLLFNCLFNLIS